MGSGFAKKKKQAREMQNQLLEMQNKMKNAEAIGSAGNGLVTITLTSSEIKQIKIKPECVDPEDIEGLEDLIKAAYKDAASKLEAEAAPSFPGGFPQGLPPGLF
ncbi:MAG: YbaB/EbfC family nucleoid-associated protein [Parachlamydiaceae bacterium]